MSAPAQEPTATRTTSGIAIEDLRIGLTARPGVDVVDDIDLVLRPGEIVGLVGESGSGKTTVGTALLGYTRAGAAIEQGKILFEDKDVLGLPWQQVRQLRGEEIAYVPQDPASALNPAIRIGRQIVELMELRGLGTSESRLPGARDGLADAGEQLDELDGPAMRLPGVLLGEAVGGTRTAERRGYGCADDSDVGKLCAQPGDAVLHC